MALKASEGRAHRDISSPRASVEGEDDQYILRHITCIRVKNFTPFPARDTLASALSQPSEQPQFTPFGSHSDDLDVAFPRKHSRKMSLNSTGSLKDGIEGEFRVRERKRTLSRTSVSDSSRPPFSTPSAFRARAGSSASTFSDRRIPQSYAPAIWNDLSQTELERVMRSRLVETFISVKASLRPPPSPPQDTPDTVLPSTASSTDSHGPPSPTISPTSPHLRHQRSVSTGSRLTKPSAKLTHVSRSSVHLPDGVPEDLSLDVDTQTPLPTPPHRPKLLRWLRVPDYISSVHPPSTNPSFPVDFRSPAALPPWTDRAASSVTISLWARVFPTANDKGKRRGQERANESDRSEPHWKLLEEWIVDLSDLIPLPGDLRQRPSRIPFNTLLLSLSTSDQVFYLPASCAKSPSSPTAEYSSDPETSSAKDVPRARSLSRTREPPIHTAEVSDVSPTESTGTSRHQTLTASSHTLLTLANNQSTLSDMQQSLTVVARVVNEYFAADPLTRSKRLISEKQARVDEWRMSSGKVRESVEELAQRIRDKRLAFQDRREELELALSLLAEEREVLAQTESELVAQRARNAELQERIEPVRSSLLSALSFIFPIELRSGPDLLFTIIEVSLPIPQGTTDPAPPLSLPEHRDVTEDTVASALGHAALAVQLLASYTNRPLVYPITFIGSRSIIHDGISAMVGPRMFPLFSRGVDAKRFMYGVYLLNKNIELLMAERDLRALDMRHTLPNLKNLLLTLTAGDPPPVPPSRTLTSSPALSIRSLTSPPPSRPTSPSLSSPTPAVGGGLATPDDASAAGEVDADTGSGSGTSTPKVQEDPSSGSGSRLSFFGFSGFLRTRTAQAPSVRVVPEDPEQEAQTRPQTPAAGSEANGSATGAAEGGTGAEGAEKGACGAEGDATQVVAPSS